ncbi:hypothetical protein HZ326_24131 [Fusarium oxysporum f. sp. albedinis]|nr:hypothetical protein HZ326_24131 [Fusarium oxysporum f. sp. albedinis]
MFALVFTTEIIREFYELLFLVVTCCRRGPADINAHRLDHPQVIIEGSAFKLFKQTDQSNCLLKRCHGGHNRFPYAT